MKRITLEDLKNELKAFIESYFEECVAKYENGHDTALMLHWFEETYMEKHMADMALDQVTFRIFLRKVLTNFYTKKDVDEKLDDQKWDLIDFINESILTVVPYKDKDGNLLTNKSIDELIGRVLYDGQEEKFFQFRDNEKGEIYTYYLYGEELRDNQIVFLENMPSLAESIYYMKDGKLESIEYIKQVSIGGENLPKENGVVDLPKATDTTLGVVKGGENVAIGEDGSINVDVPVSIDEVVNLRSITTEPATANEGDCYYNSTEKLIHYYIDGAWDAGAKPQKSKVYFFEDGTDIHQYRSDGNILIEIQDTPQIATNTSLGIVKGGGDITIDEDGTMRVNLQPYGVATTTQLGLVMASEGTNNTAEDIKKDGNVQVSVEGKMRVRKIVEEKSEGYDKNLFIVNPDKTIDELKDGEWKHVTSETKTVTSDLTLDALYTFSRTDWNWTNTAEETIKEGLLHIELPEGSDSVTLTISGPEEIQTTPSPKKYMYYETGVCSNGYKAATRYECYENIIYDIKLTTNKNYTDQYPNGLIEPSGGRVSGGKLIREFTIKSSGDYYVFLKTEDAYLERIGNGEDGCYSNTTDSTPTNNPWAYDVKVKCTYLKEITTEVRYTGQNIVLGKNGLLIESAGGEAYIKVLEDGTIKHNFGDIQSTGQANVIEEVRVNNTPLRITDKSVNVQIAQNGELIKPNTEGVIDIIASGGGGDVDLSGIEQDIAELGGRVDAIENSLGDIETALTTINETLEAL